jgi:hypothetical protein
MVLVSLSVYLQGHFRKKSIMFTFHQHPSTSAKQSQQWKMLIADRVGKTGMAEKYHFLKSFG